MLQKNEQLINNINIVVLEKNIIINDIEKTILRDFYTFTLAYSLGILVNNN